MTKEIEGQYIYIDEVKYYKITNVDEMEPFLMSIISSTNHWMFIGSNGGLTAGRVNPEQALFPYYTEDKVIQSAHDTGSVMMVRVKKEGKTYLWRPFTKFYEGWFNIESNMYKSMFGDHLIFEEINHTLQLSVAYSWTFSEEFGFVRQAEIKNLSDADTSVELLDGLQNLMPAAVGTALQTERSSLVNAYKQNEYLEGSTLGMYSLSSRIIDRAEPSEALLATSVWQAGLENGTILTCSRQMKSFIQDTPLHPEPLTKAVPGAYLSAYSLHLKGNEKKEWIVVAEVNQSTTDIIDLSERIKQSDIREQVLQSVQKNRKGILNLMSKTDGLQRTADAVYTARHFSNVLFNSMRGGLFVQDYSITLTDFLSYVQHHNQQAFEIANKALPKDVEKMVHGDFLRQLKAINDRDLSRLATEYLPLSFSRRHGDPSRPWNNFSIEMLTEEGEQKFSFEGNWRDIFQNWEALGFSYPGFLDSIITKFLNATTIDGYNPYRITNEGIDWEVIEPDNPWSYIGYWKDHQIIYLQKLLELFNEFFPERLSKWLNQERFVFAHVPYRLKSFADIESNPFDTIDYDFDAAKQINQDVQRLGADGKLVLNAQGKVMYVTLAEKLLVLSLTKLYNFIPQAGIWLNTQRPEWNDANNALVGNGTSMVTVNYLRRHLQFIKDLVDKQDRDDLSVRASVLNLYHAVENQLDVLLNNKEASNDNAFRYQVVSALGQAGETYRTEAYATPDSPKQELTIKELSSFIQKALHVLDDCIAANKRADGLYHAYNVITIANKEIQVDYLYEMLEGQVAALSSGVLQPKEALHLLDQLKASKMFRQDQFSYMLYPNRQLKNFIDKNNIPSAFASQSALLAALAKANDYSLVEKDASGGFHFAKHITNKNDVNKALNHLQSNGFAQEVSNEKEALLNAFEESFNHKSFTGRSGTFYGYEGLGSIYWHMVSKLLLATQEALWQAHEQEEDDVTIGKLIEHYYEIRAGIGINKSPELYGAVPSDPYSHTPAHSGAKQPGMTGQVKEDIMCRWGELGLRIQKGEIHIDPFFLHDAEFFSEARPTFGKALHDTLYQEEIPANALAFTYGETPVLYHRSNTSRIDVQFSNGTKQSIEGNVIPKEIATELFTRTQVIQRLDIYLNQSNDK